MPGYDKDQYIDASLKDENGKAYAYRDAAGNYYELKFGLRTNAPLKFTKHTVSRPDAPVTRAGSCIKRRMPLC